MCKWLQCKHNQGEVDSNVFLVQSRNAFNSIVDKWILIFWSGHSLLREGWQCFGMKKHELERWLDLKPPRWTSRMLSWLKKCPQLLESLSPAKKMIYYISEEGINFGMWCSLDVLAWSRGVHILLVIMNTLKENHSVCSIVAKLGSVICSVDFIRCCKHPV